MNGLTRFLFMVAALILGYLIARYEQGSTRLYSIAAAQGHFSQETSPSPIPLVTYTFEMRDLDKKYPYISDETPHAIKHTELTHLFEYWQQNKEHVLNGILCFKSNNIIHKKWVKVSPKSYDTAQNKAVFSIEPLSSRRKDLKHREDPEKLDYATVLEPNLVILSAK